MNQTQLWLAPLLIGSLFGVIACLRVPLWWSAGYLTQHLLIAITAICGFFFKPDWLFAVAGWILFFVFNVGRRIIVSSIGSHLSSLRTTMAARQARLLKLLAWGPPGRFWTDLVDMLSFYSKNQKAQAEAVANRWYALKLPYQMRDTLTAYALTGLVMNRDWPAVLKTFEGAIADYEKENQGKRKKLGYPAQAAISAMRAYLESTNFNMAVDCLAKADLPSNFHSKEALDTIFVSFFSLSGATKDLEQLLDGMSPPPLGMPEYARIFWRGRCAAANGNFQQALQYFDECISKLPKDDENWRDRVIFQKSRVECSQRSDSLPAELTEAAAHLNRLAEVTEPVTPVPVAQASEPLLQQARDMREHAMTVAQIMDAGKRGPAVRGLVMVLAIIFAFGLTGQVSNNKWIDDIYYQLFTGGLLQGTLVLQGQWWRVLTYSFLHANLSHLFMNLFGLVWLGKHVENVYGSLRFLIIFFGTGIMSGAAQMLLTPQEPAVGASGAVMGIFGASAAATLRLKKILPPKVRSAELKWMLGMAVMQITFDQLVNYASTLSSHEQAVRIASYAHAGGIFAGFFMGLILPMKPFREPKEFARNSG